MSICRIDATADDGSFGRMVNDDHKSPNLKPHYTQKEVPAIQFEALQDIEPLEELTYKYGSGPYEWRKKVSNNYLLVAN
jgi:hypothetical protein